MKKIIQRTLNNSTLPDYREVVITFIDDDGVNKQETIFVTIKIGEKDQYYLDEAQRHFENKYHIPSTLPRRARIKKKPLLIAVASLVLVAGITTGVTLGVVLSNGGNVETEDKFDKMKTYYKDYLIRNTNIDNYKDLTAKEILERGAYWKKNDEGQNVYTKLIKKTMVGVTTYYMEDINYEDGSNRDSWPAASHISQAKAIAITAEVKNDPEIMEIAAGMTYYWVYNNFRNTNWWHNDLGAGANDLANLGIFTYDHLNEQGKSMLVSKVANASMYYRPSLLTHAGTNLFDYADITLRSSIFTKNEEEFKTVVNRIEEEITDRHLEGFQKDGSFFQHGQQVQIASYGKGVIRLAKVLKAISVSGEKFSEEKMHIIERYLLTGLRNMTHKGYLNYSAMSREHVRKNNLSAANNNFSQFSEYLDIDSFTRKEDLKDYLDSIDNKEACADELIYFDRAKMITMNLDGLYMSFKGTDSYLTNTECVNSENRLGLNLSYGTNTCVMDDGDEYYNISPLWNYAYIPGTTSIQLVDETIEDFTIPEKTDMLIRNIAHLDYKDELYEQQLPEQKTGNDIMYNGAIYPNNANAVTPTEIAVLMQKSVHHEENKFTVTCIATKDGMLLLGNGLTYTGSKTGYRFTTNRKLHTTLEQSFYKGDKRFNIDADNGKWMTHGNALYKIVDYENGYAPASNPDNRIIAEKPQLEIYGAWARNRNPSEGEVGLDASGNLLLAYIQHDSATNEEYAYSIQPTTKENMDFKLYHNSSEDGVQEVALPNGKTVIVFYKNLGTTYTDHNNYKYEPNEVKEGQVIIYDN